MWGRSASAEEVQGLGEHLLARLHGGDVRLVGARRTDQIDHFGHRVYIRHRDVALGVGIRMRRVVHEAVRGLVLDDPGDADAALRAAVARAGGGERAGEAVVAGRLGDDLLASVGAPGGGARALGVGEVLRRDVHAQALGAQGARGDVEGAEEAHQDVPIADWMMSMRPRATWTRAWYSRPFWAILADSTSMSMPLPSWRMTSVCVVGGKPALETALRSPAANAAWSAEWKSTSFGLKFGVFAFARLEASAVWRCAAPSMARCRPSWVVSNCSMRAEARRGARPWAVPAHPSMGAGPVIGPCADSLSVGPDGGRSAPWATPASARRARWCPGAAGAT